MLCNLGMRPGPAGKSARGPGNFAQIFHPRTRPFVVAFWAERLIQVFDMFRLTILLCLGLYATLQIAGADRGQMRLGLKEAQQAASATPAPAPALVTVAAPAPAFEAEAAPVVAVAFAPVAAPEPVSDPQPSALQVAEASPATDGQVMFVSGRSVNVRSGPSIGDGVVGRLTRGEAVSVVWIESNGWARIRIEGDGVDGYMSMDFLTDSAP